MEPENTNSETVEYNWDFDVSPETQKELGVYTETTTTELPAEEPKAVNVDTDTTEKKSEVETIAKRAENEPDWKFEIRNRMAELKKQKDSAETTEEKQDYKSQIDELRKSISEIARSETSEKQSEKTGDVESYVKSILEQERTKIAHEEHNKTLQNIEKDFIASKPKLSSPEEYSEFFQFFNDTFNYADKPANVVKALLNMAYDQLYSDSDVKKEQKSAEVSNAVKAVDFNGTTDNSTSNSTKEDGMSDLIQDIKSTSGRDYSWMS